ncbi:MAG: ADOP family duplicated permease [Gemmatimonadota bacterium]
MKTFLALSVARLAALRTPIDQRDDFLAEWRAEIVREVRNGAGWSIVWSAFGAFADARARRVIGRGGRRTTPDGRLALWARSLRVSARSLRRVPGFTVVCTLTLAVGLGGSTAIYTLLDRIVLDPLPYPDSDRLVNVDNQVPGVGPDEVWWLSTAQWAFYTEHAAEFEALGIYRSDGANVMTASGPVRARTAHATREVLPLLGAAPALGRLLLPSDDAPEAPVVAVVSHSFWRDELGGDPEAVGSSLSLGGQPIAVVGVLDEDVILPHSRLAQAPEVWLPMQIDRGGQFWNSHRFRAIGLLAEGVNADAAENALGGLRDRLPERFPDAYSQGFFDQYGFRTSVSSLRASVVGDTAETLWVLFGGVALVLFIACANVANLFLVRVEGRRHELALRIALGADRASVGRYVFSDGLALAALGAGAGLAITFAAVPAIAAFAPDGVPRLDSVAAGFDTVAFTVAAALAVAVAISAWPIVARRGPVSGAIGSGRSSGTLGQSRLRGALVVSQIALAMSLLVGAGLLLQSVGTLRANDPGFTPDDVATVQLFASSDRYPDDVALWQFHRTVLDRVGSIPGVLDVGMGEEVPVDGSYGCTVQGFEDESIYDRVRAQGLTTCAGQTRVTPGYFESLGIPLLEGRYLDAGDNDDPDRAAVVVSQAFAERFWPGESPIGRGLGPGGRTIPPFFHVVGVVGDIPRRAEAGRPPLADDAIAVYYPGVYPRTENRWGGWWPGRMTLVVHAESDASRLIPEIRRVVHDIDPEVPLANPRLMADVVEEASASVTFLSTLLLIAAGSALLLAAVGLYGVVSRVVTRKTREIGTRLAIGAHPGLVVRGVVGGTMRLAIFGLLIGVPLAIFTSRLGQAVLVGVSPTSPLAYIGAGVLIGAVTLLAAYVPARRAAAIDPASSLRYE